jgi:EAL domain-containing protein (putative c-di-GMP-specific phosphodiesterase class I)
MTPTNIRKTLVAMMARYNFTPKMCADKTSDQLLHLAAMLVGHRRYLGLLQPDELIRLTEMEKLVAELKRTN